MERRRAALARLDAFEDAAHTDSVDQGREYRDPNTPPKPGGPHYDLTRYHQRHQSILALAYPDQFTPEQQHARKVQAEEAAWDLMERAMTGGLQA
ncbi:hypothetical protein IHN63_01955 [Deinococcus sp. 6YEL10]|uniref:hypothetical protein n=1 Tax=Deinococcus sp. 6YEL10 TaxID=2745870 RepID=UPI001E4B2D6D|nr:hypothetical protein [Deinococcus sp. 6YEL10]MCD0160063.1 hypothetical protein [Deinococcus sp. 6YEL10]